jgi:carboxyl-terminal processing protease
MRRGFMLAVFISLVAQAAYGPAAEPTRAMDAYEHVQDMRREADKMAAKDAGEAGLQEAAKHLEAALDYLHREDIEELATGNPYLYGRGHDVRVDLAEVYSRMGEKQKALSLLESVQHFSWSPAVGAWLAKNDAFSNLRDEPRFQAVLATQTVPDHIWNAGVIGAPYKDKLTTEERVAGLSLFWAEARQGFVYFDHVPDLSWDKVYLEFLPKVMAAQTTRDYYRVMMQLAPLLKDAHTNIYPPDELSDFFYARPPISTIKIDSKVLIQWVGSTSLSRRVHVGDEIVALDGMPIQEYAREYVEPFVSSSTSQDRDLRMFTYQLLSGRADQSLQLLLRDKAGRERTEVVARSGYSDVQERPQFQFRMLADEIAYIALDHFESDAGVKAFEAALPDIMKAKALVIDVRRNGGGSTNYGLAVLSYLSKEPIYGSISYRRGESSLDRARGTNRVAWTPLPDNGQPYRKPRDQIFTGPVAMLIGPRTFSAAEDFVVAYQSMKRGITLGEPTGGSTGQPLSFGLPGGGSARICVKRDVYPDGTEFVGKGISPTIQVSLSVDDLRAGRDPVLERAVKELMKGNAGSSR